MDADNTGSSSDGTGPPAWELGSFQTLPPESFEAKGKSKILPVYVDKEREENNSSSLRREKTIVCNIPIAKRRRPEKDPSAVVNARAPHLMTESYSYDDVVEQIHRGDKKLL
ncbi:hypothetical protein TREES_T100003193 [Tupaia chinensis]|uniref:Uncharacterized protein n=1 Tax=Tupaia chinensis TaxID=246437 RepID=L9KEV5_TUPCH|nr:hypothetical protein TREES_T100003193 [Tupaia chinensis]